MKRVLLVLLALACLPAAARPEPRRITVAAVQLEVRPSAYASVGSFQEWIADRVEQCLPYRPDLIVFPEYSAVFVALIPHPEALRRAGTLVEGWQALQATEPLARSLRELFLLNSGFAERVVREVFGGLARRHRVYILGGSYFAGHPAEDQPAEPGRMELRNRALLFGPDGSELYWQDKVFLTEFETGVLGLSPGSLAEARSFEVGSIRIGLTLCRDTFHREWEAVYRACDLWLDIKANGTAYTPEEAASFRQALPARLGPAGVPYGLTTCLTGRFLDLFWEGPSSLSRLEDGRPRRVRSAFSPRGGEILAFALPFGSTD